MTDYRLAEACQALADSQRRDRPDLAHLSNATIAWLFAPSPLTLRGHPVAAFISGPRVQGPLSSLVDALLDELTAPVTQGEALDFLVLVDEAHWQTLTPIRRDRLVYHELLHVTTKDDEYGIPRLTKDGRLQLRLQPHDRELFDAELLRYGATTCGHKDLLGIVLEGELAAAGKPVLVVKRHE